MQQASEIALKPVKAHHKDKDVQQLEVTEHQVR